ncbi:MAG: hypothetical protein KKE50_04350 [Nanoarchaeota archaeon]|nr:hypothetical protein [Nanoarchaeota archaeon]
MSDVSPVILLIAILLDIFGLFCLILTFTVGATIGEGLSFVPDILGLILIGGSEMFMKRRQSFSQAKTVGTSAVSNAKKQSGLKFLGTFIGELLPFVGAFPFWTIHVLFSYGPSESEDGEPASDIT